MAEYASLRPLARGGSRGRRPRARSLLPGVRSERRWRASCAAGRRPRSRLLGGALGRGARTRRARGDGAGAPSSPTSISPRRASAACRPTWSARFLLRQLAEGAGLTLHVRLIEGRDTEHVLEAIFKALGVALAQGRPAPRHAHHEKGAAVTKTVISDRPGAPGPSAARRTRRRSSANRFDLHRRPDRRSRGRLGRARRRGHRRSTDRAGDGEPEGDPEAATSWASTVSSRRPASSRTLRTSALSTRSIARHVGDTPPARATIEVSALPSGAKLEIEAIALAG